MSLRDTLPDGVRAVPVNTCSRWEGHSLVDRALGAVDNDRRLSRDAVHLFKVVLDGSLGAEDSANVVLQGDIRQGGGQVPGL